MVLQEIALLVMTFSGYAVGQILANFSEDEVKDKTGKKYFQLLRNLTAFSVILIMLLYLKHSIFSISLLIILIIFFVYSYKKTNKTKELFMYLLFFVALITVLSRGIDTLTFLTASLIFVFLLASVAFMRK